MLTNGIEAVSQTGMVCEDTRGSLQKKPFLPVSQHFGLSDHSLEDFNRKSSSLNIAVCGVIFNVRIGKDFGLKNSVFYIRTGLTENNRFLCIFSFTVFTVKRIFYYCHKVKDLCSALFIDDNP